MKTTIEFDDFELGEDQTHVELVSSNGQRHIGRVINVFEKIQNEIIDACPINAGDTLRVSYTHHSGELLVEVVRK